MSAPRIVIAAGGTAGHVVPAIAVADALRAEGAEVSFVGGERAEAELVPKAGYELDTLNVEGISRSNPLKAARALGKAGAAVGAARKILKARRADAVLGGGGYVAGPGRPRGDADQARRSCSTEADSHLGLSNRALASRARRVCLAFPLEGRDGDALPRHRPPRPAQDHRPRPRPRAARHRAPTRPACSSSAARSARARSTPPRLRRSRTRRTASSTSPARATTRTCRRPGRTTCCSTT